MEIKVTELTEKIKQTLLQKNFSSEDAEKIIDYFIWAQASKIHTQGIVKMTWAEAIQDIIPKHEIKIEKDTPVSQLINAGAQPSILVSQIATDTVISKAKKSWMAIVALHNTFSSNGAQWYYSEKIAKNDLIGIVVSRSPWSVSPFNSIDPLFWTNPIGFSFPTEKLPCTFDIATSAMTFYGLILADWKGQKIPEWLAIDKNGNITNSPSEAMSWAILPFDKSYKSSALSMMVELLSWPLASSCFCDYKTFDEEWGSTFIAINPDILLDIDKFKKNASKMLEIIKNSRTKNNAPVRIPWEESQKNREKAFSSWYVEVDEMIMKDLNYI